MYLCKVASGTEEIVCLPVCMPGCLLQRIGNRGYLTVLEITFHSSLNIVGTYCRMCDDCSMLIVDHHHRLHDINLIE